MVLPLQTGLIETTRGTPSGWGIDIDYLWLNSGNEKKHGPGFDLFFYSGAIGGRPTVSYSRLEMGQNGNLPTHHRKKVHPRPSPSLKA